MGTLFGALAMRALGSRYGWLWTVKHAESWAVSSEPETSQTRKTMGQFARMLSRRRVSYRLALGLSSRCLRK